MRQYACLCTRCHNTGVVYARASAYYAMTRALDARCARSQRPRATTLCFALMRCAMPGTSHYAFAADRRAISRYGDAAARHFARRPRLLLF